MKCKKDLKYSSIKQRIKSEKSQWSIKTRRRTSTAIILLFYGINSVSIERLTNKIRIFRSVYVVECRIRPPDGFICNHRCTIEGWERRAAIWIFFFVQKIFKTVCSNLFILFYLRSTEHLTKRKCRWQHNSSSLRKVNATSGCIRRFFLYIFMFFISKFQIKQKRKTIFKNILYVQREVSCIIC